jgi:hypothetical protein
MKKVFNEKTLGEKNAIPESRILRDILRDRGLEVRTRWLHERINERGEVEEAIMDVAVDGEIPVLKWARDCDMCESTSVRVIPATVSAFEALKRQMYYDAEGPFSLEVIDWEQYAEFNPTFRDRALEAFEDGHAHIIY